MSCSSESDVTIPIEDSPEPSPPHKRSTGRGGGVDNKGYVSSKDEKKDTSLVLETRLDSNIVNLIPAKPSPQLGPFEPLNDYFIPINHHKKFLRRSEKLYVTKSKKSGRNWGRVFCGGLGCFILIGLIAVAVLVILDVLHLPLGSLGGEVSELMASSSSTSMADHSSSSGVETSTASMTSTDSIVTPTASSIYLRNTADVEFSLENEKYEAALANKSSTHFNQLALQLQALVTGMLGGSIQPESVVARVQEFTPENDGGIYTKLRVGWTDETLTLQGLQYALRNVTSQGLGTFSIKRLKFFDVVNLCQFSNHGCSHNCSFHAYQLQFQCSCPDPLLLAVDFKTCVEVIPSVTEVSSTEGKEEQDENAPTTTPEHTPSSTSTSTTTATTTHGPEVPPEPTLSTTTTTTSTTTATTTTTMSPIVDQTTESSNGAEEGVTAGNMGIDAQSEPIATTPEVAEPEAVTEMELGGSDPPEEVGQTEMNDLEKNVTMAETEMEEIATTMISSPESDEEVGTERVA